MSDTNEGRWFKVAIFIMSGFVAAVSIANIYYFDRIRKASCSAVSSGTAGTLLILNIIIFIVTILIFVWSLIKLLFSGSPNKGNSQNNKSLTTTPISTQYYSSQTPVYYTPVATSVIGPVAGPTEVII